MKTVAAATSQLTASRLPPQTRIDPMYPGWRTSPVLRWIVVALVTVAGIVSIYYVVRTGDSGAHAVWEGR